MGGFRKSHDPLRLALARRCAAALALVGTLIALCTLLPFNGIQQAKAATPAAQATADKSLAPQDSSTIRVEFPSTVNSLSDSAVALDYSDDLFAGSSATYNVNLAYASACLAAASGSSNVTPEYKASVITKLLRDGIGCSVVETNNFQATPLAESNVGTAIGLKEIQAPKADGSGDEACKLIILGVRGYGYDGEWASNFTVGSEGDHQGFADTRDRVLYELLTFIRNNTSEGDRIKIWMTGFSRAGVTANMTGAWIDIWAGTTPNVGISPQIAHATGSYDQAAMRWTDAATVDLTGRRLSTSDVYCYPVCPPQGTTKENVEQYNNLCSGIHNLINPDDWVPQVAMDWWGFARYGTDHDITSPDHAAAPDRTTPVLPAKEAAVKAMLARLKNISPNSAYTSPWFKQYYFSIWSGGAKEDTGGSGNNFVSKGRELKSQQGLYFSEFGQFLTDAIGANSRQNYTNDYQDSIVYLSRTLLSLPPSKFAKLGNAFKTNLTNALRTKLNLPNLNLDNPGTSALRVLNLVKKGGPDLNQVCYSTLTGAYTELGIAYDDTSLRGASEALSKIVSGVVNKDTTYFYHVMTLVQNAGSVIQAHMPESVLAWFEGCDRVTEAPVRHNRAALTFYGNYNGTYAESQAERVFTEDIYEGDILYVSSDAAPTIDGEAVDDGVVHYTPPEREGYSFVGWTSKPVEGEAVDQVYGAEDIIAYGDFPTAQTASGAVSLYAMWEGEDEINDMVDDMTTDDKISQMIIPAMRTWNGENLTSLDGKDELVDALKRHNYGGIILYGENIKTVDQTVTLVDDLNEANSEYSFVPYLMCTDGEGGLVTRLSMGTRMTGSMAIGATNDPSANAYTTGRVIGEELAACGFNVDFAPDADVNSNPANPVIGTRSFADDAATVATLGPRFATGLAQSNVVATYKHFPGHGDTSTDSHTDETKVMKTYDQLNQTEFVPFRAAVQQDADLIMTAHVTLPLADDVHELGDGTTGYYPATMSQRVLTGYLREDIGYDGVIVTDAMEMDALYKRQLVPGNNTTRDIEYCTNLATKVIEAGGDILLLPRDMKNADALTFMDDYIDALVSRVDGSAGLTEQVNRAVTRILTLKKEYGMLDDYEEKSLDDRIAAAQDVVGSDEHHADEKSIAEDAITVLKNDDLTLPINGNSGNVVLVGRNSDDVKTIDYAVRQAQIDGAVSADARIVNLATGTTTGPADAPITITLDYYRTYDTAEHLRITDQLRSAVSQASSVAVLTTTYGASGLANQAVQVQAVNELMAAAHTAGAKFTLISDNLPYDVARFMDADAHVCAYMAAGLGVDPAYRDAQGHQNAFNANVTAAVEMLFDVTQPHGRVPVNVPNVTVNPDGTIAYSDTNAYERWSGEDGFDYAVVRGGGAAYSHGAPDGLSFLANARADRLRSVRVDGRAIDAGSYQVAPGFTELTLKSDYLDTLSGGEHSLELMYDYGEGEFAVPTSFSVGDMPRQMYRLYNPNSGEHFYTASVYERDAVEAAGWTYEGEAWKAPVKGTPVYRLYNPNAGDHHYTISEEEKNVLVQVGWTFEGVGWYSAPSTGVPIWREYNPNAIAGAHNFTASAYEHLQLVLNGWFGEGIAWYGAR